MFSEFGTLSNEEIIHSAEEISFGLERHLKTFRNGSCVDVDQT